MADPILAVQRWRSNAEMIASAVVPLGYLRAEWLTLDPTFGRGCWWKLWRPQHLVAHDLELDGVDFRQLPHPDGSFDAVVFDPPYKLNGTPTPSVDGRYGVGVKASRAERHEMALAGLEDCIRVLASPGVLLVKAMDQVSGGQMRWQTDLFTTRAASHGLRKVDVLHMLGGRAQPADRRQVHARHNYSTLLVFKKATGRMRSGG